MLFRSGPPPTSSGSGRILNFAKPVFSFIPTPRSFVAFKMHAAEP